MSMPTELSQLIQEFARPRSRPDWRKGGSFPSTMYYQGILLDSRYRHLFYLSDFVGVVQPSRTLSEEAVEFYLSGYDLY
jgi:hypothetical protein